MLMKLVLALSVLVAPELRWDAPKPTVVEAPQVRRVALTYAVALPQHLALRDMPDALSIIYAVMGLAGMPTTSWWALLVERHGPDIEVRWRPGRYRYALTLDRQVHADQLWYPRHLVRQQEELLLLQEPFGGQLAQFICNE